MICKQKRPGHAYNVMSIKDAQNGLDFHFNLKLFPCKTKTFPFYIKYWLRYKTQSTIAGVLGRLVQKIFSLRLRIPAHQAYISSIFFTYHEEFFEMQFAEMSLIYYD